MFVTGVELSAGSDGRVYDRVGKRGTLWARLDTGLDGLPLGVTN